MTLLFSVSNYWYTVNLKFTVTVFFKIHGEIKHLDSKLERINPGILVTLMTLLKGILRNPDSDSKKIRTRKNPDSCLKKTRTWLLKTRTRNRKNRIQNKDSVYENAKVFWKGLIIVNMINDDLFTIISINKFLECCLNYLA